MLVWLKIKTAVCNWCKKYWQILAGFFGALLAVFAMSGGSNREARKLLDKKNELLQKEDEALRQAREAEDEAIRENIDRFFEAEDTAKSELLARLNDLDDQQRARVKELLESENPEEEIAAGLRRFLE